jgi:PAS domain S-box-containing protein
MVVGAALGAMVLLAMLGLHSSRLLTNIEESSGAPLHVVRTTLLFGTGLAITLIGIGAIITWHEMKMRVLSEERFRNAVEYSAIGMSLVAPDGRWVKVNPALCKIVGYTQEELLARTFQDITHPDDLAGDLVQVGELLAGRITHYSMEKRYFHQTGRIVWILLNVSLVRDLTGEPLYFVSQIMDITERKQAEGLMRASLSEKETLLREIHHRVKNNMQVISSLLALQSGYVEEPRSKRFFEDCQRRVRTMALIHEKLYRSANLSTIDFGEHLREIAGMFSQAYSDTARRVATEVHADPVTLDMDTAVPLGLIVNELVTNALKHGFPDGRSGRLSISLTDTGEKLTLRVSDDGVGLPENFSATESGSLGMKLVRSLSRQIRAELSIVYNGPGASVSVTLAAPERKSAA